MNRLERELNSIYVMWLRHMKGFLRTPGIILGSIFQPLLFMVAFGLGIGKMASVSTSVNFFEFILAGIVGMGVIFSSIMGGISVLWDRKFGFLKEVLVAPVSRISIVFGRALGTLTTSLFQGILILVLGILLGAGVMPGTLWMSLVFMVLLSFFCLGLGLVIASRVEDMESFQFFQTMVIMPMIFISTAFIPVEIAPAWLADLIHLNPISYMIDGIRAGMTGVSYFSPWSDGLVAASFSCLALLLAAWSFEKMEV